VAEGAGLVGRAAGLAFGDAGSAELAGQLRRRGGVDVEDEIADRGQNHDADAAPRHGPAAEAAPVVDVAAAPSTLPPHARSPSALMPKLGRNAVRGEGMQPERRTLFGG